jgi:hypothetical protein
MTDNPREETRSKSSKQENLQLLRRIFVSYSDFQQAAAIASHILVAELHRDYPDKDRHILQALNCAMIVAYARPFSGNRGSKTMLPALPERFLSGFTPDERALHKIVMKDRNEALAHSDHAAWHLRLCFMRSPGRRPMLAPLHRDTRAPLDDKHTRLFYGMAIKLMEAVFAERCILEGELADLLPTFKDGRIRGDELAMRQGGWL